MKNMDSDYSVRLATLAEMGGDTTGKTYNSVYDIDLEILRLTRQSGGSAISIVSELPNAEQNKDKFVRLSTDKKVYVADVVSSSTSEVVAPDSEQIDNAYLEDMEGDYAFYKGQCTLLDITTSDTYTAYRWYFSEYDNNLFTVKSPDELTTPYVDYAYAGEDNFTDDGNNIYSNSNIVVSVDNLYQNFEITSYHIVKQTVTTETWGWKQL